MAKLYFYYSAMNAGKTTTLLQSAHNYHERGMRTLILVPQLDHRYGIGVVASRIGLKAEGRIFDREDDLHAILFKMVNRPLIELLAQVSMRFYRSGPIPQIFDGVDGIRAWRLWRHQIIEAILANDPARARFEAERHRRLLMQRVAARAL